MEHKNKKWQNLIEKKCPICGELLTEVKSRTILYECECGFLISRRRYAEILMDDQHILRQFLTPDQSDKLIASLNSMYNV